MCPLFPKIQLTLTPTCQHGRATRHRQLGQDEVARHLHIGVVREAADQVRVNEAGRVDAVQARVQQGVHALEGSLPDFQAVVDRVLERAQVHYPVEGRKRAFRFLRYILATKQILV
jgi:hypothetical protein